MLDWYSYGPVKRVPEGCINAPMDVPAVAAVAAVPAVAAVAAVPAVADDMST